MWNESIWGLALDPERTNGRGLRLRSGDIGHYVARMSERPVDPHYRQVDSNSVASAERLILHCDCAGLSCIPHGVVDAVGEYLALGLGAWTAIIIQDEGKDGERRLC